jgi:hypothetical protein
LNWSEKYLQSLCHPPPVSLCGAPGFAAARFQKAVRETLHGFRRHNRKN